jgi:hypothetical protein
MAAQRENAKTRKENMVALKSDFRRRTSDIGKSRFLAALEMTRDTRSECRE